MPETPPTPLMTESLLEKLAEHRIALVATAVFLVLIILLRLLLPASDRRRLTFPLVMLCTYLASVPVRALLAYVAPTSPWHDGITLLANLSLGFGIIAISGLMLFNVLARSLRNMRILRDITSVVTGVALLFVLLTRAHVNILPLITTSAVLTAVLGLALQDTLGNLFAGIALQLEPTMTIGDWITVGDTTGQVQEIRWRSTSIVTRNDDLVVFPNSMLAKGTIINLSRPNPWHRQWVHFDVHYRHPPNEVQRVVLEAIAGVKNVKQDNPAPDCIYYRMEQDHAHYAVRYRLLDLRHDDGTDSEVKKRIWYAFKRSGIEIPYPAANVFLTELNKEREHGKWERERLQRLESLRQVDLFSPLDVAHLDLLAERLHVEIYGQGERILGQGQPGDSLYLIRHGTVSVRVGVSNGHSDEKEIATLGVGKFFGEMSLLTGERRHATVVALSDVECYVIDHDLFQQVLASRTSLVTEIGEILDKRLHELQGEVAGLGAEPDKPRRDQADLLSRIRRFFRLDG